MGARRKLRPRPNHFRRRGVFQGATLATLGIPALRLNFGFRKGHDATVLSCHAMLWPLCYDGGGMSSVLTVWRSGPLLYY